MRQTLHSETWTRKPRFVWAVALPVAAASWSLLGLSLYGGVTLGLPASKQLFWALAVIMGLLVPALIASIRLIIRVDEDALRVRLVPIWATSIPLDRIERVEPVAYRPLLEYGGWGVRYGIRRGGWAWTIGGNRGVRLTLAEGRSILIGTETPEALAAAIEDARRRLGAAVAG